MTQQEQETLLLCLMPKIGEINYLIEEYFQTLPNEDTVTARQVANFARSRSCQISASAIRDVLRRLDDLGELKRIPHIKPDRKARVTYWKFRKDEIYTGI